MKRGSRFSTKASIASAVSRDEKASELRLTLAKVKELGRIPGAEPGRLYEISEPERGRDQRGQTLQPSESAQLRNQGSDPFGPRTPTLFEDVSEQLDATHTETWFNDFARQPLLPHSLSQLGPGVSWLDLDEDGREDLVIPDGAGGELAWYRNEQERFTRVPLGFPAGGLDFTMALAAPSPEGQGGGRSLLVGRSSYRAATLEEALQLAGVARLELSPDGRQVVQAEAVALPDSASVGALALADLSANGRLDLLVAGRVIPGAWPVPASSRLYRNLAGRFEQDPRDISVLHGAGPVSGALFSDLNGDGWPDLVLAVDGGPIRLFLNQRGRLTEATERFGLARLTGNWNGIAAGDFDGDGRLDLVATNWGRNLTYRASAQNPLLLYMGRFGPNPTLDVVPAAWDSAIGAVAPLTSFARLTRALPNLRRQVPTFRAYAAASIEQLLGPPAARARRIAINTLDHLVLLNRGDRFEPHPLPDEAQFAPGFGAVVSDFDGDGREDLFLAQNFSQTELGTPRFDAGRGLLLLGDGKGGFAPMPGQFSGIAVYGDQRGAAAADFDGDGRVDLAVSQNAAESRLFRNRGAAPGLRVRLKGRPGNPDAIGAQVRVRYQDGLGPVREVQAGSGYWSSNGAVLVMGLRTAPVAVVVRWVGGTVSEVPVSGAGEVIVEEGGRAARR